MVFPTAYGFDLDGPDRGGSIYVHGSVASRSLAPDSEICITITILDGLVLARSGFHHSMNYRSGVIIGSPRVVTDGDERVKALNLIVDQVVPRTFPTLAGSHAQGNGGNHRSCAAVVRGFRQGSHRRPR